MIKIPEHLTLEAVYKNLDKKFWGEKILKKWEKNRPSRPFPIVGVLDNVRSAYNVGSIFRTSACAYIEKLVLCGITPYPPHPKLEKTSLGTIQLVPWEYKEDLVLALKNLKEQGYKILFLEIAEDSKPIQEVKKEDFPLAIVVGNEVAGIDEKVFPWADEIVEIPLYGKKESLNVAVAYGIAIFFLIEKIRPFWK